MHRRRPFHRARPPRKRRGAHADAWAQITGEIGVALVTAGPGFANALSALFSARHSESPVLLLSGDSPVAADEDGAFQEMRQIDLTRPLVKTARRPLRVERLGHDVAAAIACARSGRPGPVHVALPFDVLNTTAGDTHRVEAAELDRRPCALPGPVADDIAGRIARARRPIVLTGPCMNRSRAGARVAALEAALRAPVVAMESPRGLRDPALGTFSDVLAASDLVILLGKATRLLGGVRPAAVVDAAADLVVIDPDNRMIDRAYRIAGGRVVVSACADADFAADALTAAAPAVIAAGSGASDPAWCDEVADAMANRTAAGTTVAETATVEAAAIGPSLPGPRSPRPPSLRPLPSGPSPPRLPPSRLSPLKPPRPRPGSASIPGFSARRCSGCWTPPPSRSSSATGASSGSGRRRRGTAPVRIVNGLFGAIGGGLCHALAAKLARPRQRSSP